MAAFSLAAIFAGYCNFKGVYRKKGSLKAAKKRTNV